MIPVLLWRCPVCGTDDALRHRLGWWNPERVWCVHCGVVWHVRRELLGDYQLKAVAGDASVRGQEAPLAEWYDRMKAGLRLVPLSDASLSLAAGEVLCVKSKRVKLLQEIPHSLSTPGIYFSNKKLGIGQLFLTSERLVWKGASTHDFWLKTVNAVWTIIDVRLAIQYQMSDVFKFQFLDESLLKWLTYIGLAAQRIAQMHGHRISVSNY